MDIFDNMRELELQPSTQITNIPTGNSYFMMNWNDLVTQDDIVSGLPTQHVDAADMRELESLLEARKEMYEQNLDANGFDVSDTTESCAIMDDLTKSLLESINQARVLYKTTADAYMDTIAKLEGLTSIKTYVSQYVKETETFTSYLNKKVLNQKIGSVDFDSVVEFEKSFGKMKECISDTITAEMETLEKNKKEYAQKISTLKPLFSLTQGVNGFRMCTVCLSREVQSYIVPCGHTFCNECLKKSKGDCFICRKRAINVSPLYFN
jgi:hypothetical protein